MVRFGGDGLIRRKQEEAQQQGVGAGLLPHDLFAARAPLVYLPRPAPSAPQYRTLLIAAGVLLGAGLGGFVDGIVLHQILQWHNLLSAQLPPDTLVRTKVNMYWDGLFHAAVWVTTAVGLYLLWAATGRPDVPRSGRTLWGSLLLGWGLFNVIEGIIDHQILGLHHVREYSPNQ